MKIRIHQIIEDIDMENLKKNKPGVEDLDSVQVMRDLAQSTDLVDGKTRKRSTLFFN